MTTVDVATTATTVIAPGNYPFIHIFNNSGDGTVIYVSYDGDDPTVAAGMPILDGTYLQLNNDGVKPLFTRGLKAIHGGSGTKELRVQGA